jgi:hypothetical protein
MASQTRGPYPTADEIAERAHQLFLAGGRRVALIPEYWRAAERELLQRAADRVLSTQPAVQPQPQKRKRL